MEAMTQRDYGSFFISIPLAEAGLCLQTMVTPGSLYQKQFTMGLILAGIFLVSCLCVIFLISRYTRGLVQKLETLNRKIDAFTSAQREEVFHENSQ